MNKVIRFALVLFATVVLVSCGGGGGTSDSGSDVPPTIVSPPAGLYLGYYQEDPLTNPEDPMPGAFILDLPANDSNFMGSMYFTYVGCQTSNAGVVNGQKSGLNLSGTWSGLVDASSQSGKYKGTYDTKTLIYSGTYTNDAGKSYHDLSPCIRYYIAPNGSWEMFAESTRYPSNFVPSLSGRNVIVPSVPNAANNLVYVIDPSVAAGAGNPVIWQTFGSTGTPVTIPSGVGLLSGHDYILVEVVTDASSKRLAFGSSRFKP